MDSDRTGNPNAERRLLAAQQIMAEDPRHTKKPAAEGYSGGAAYVIDRFVPLAEAGVPITDLGFNRGDAVYDVVSVSRGQFFRLADHQKRFAASCKRIRVTMPFSDERLTEILNQLVALTGWQDAYVWWGVTRGKTPMRSADRTDATRFTNRFFAYVLPYIFIADDERQQRGTNAVISKEYFRIPPTSVDPRAKNLLGLDFSLSLFEAGDRGAEWSILTDGQGYITEAPGSNLFVVKDGKVATPVDWCLEGITRLSVMDLAAELGLPLEVRKVTAQELLDADEAFYTSSAGGVMPLHSVDGVVLGQRNATGPGPISARMHDLYWEKRWAGWHGTPVDYSAQG